MSPRQGSGLAEGAVPRSRRTPSRGADSRPESTRPRRHRTLPLTDRFGKKAVPAVDPQPPTDVGSGPSPPPGLGAVPGLAECAAPARGALLDTLCDGAGSPTCKPPGLWPICPGSRAEEALGCPRTSGSAGLLGAELGVSDATSPQAARFTHHRRGPWSVIAGDSLRLQSS